MLHNPKPDSTNFWISLLQKKRTSGNLRFSAFYYKLIKVKNLENGTTLKNQRKLDDYKKK